MKKAIAVVLVLLLALALFIFWPRPARGIQDVDLQLAPVVVPTNFNGVLILEKAIKELPLSETARDEISTLLKPEGWNPGRATEIVAFYENGLALIELSFDAPHFHLLREPGYFDDLPELVEWRLVAQAALLKAKTLFHSGKQLEGLDLALQTVRFGHRVQQCGGSVMYYLVGTAIKSLALSVIRDMTDKIAIGCEDLRGYANALAEYRANETGLTNVLKMEYKLQVGSIRHIQTGVFPGETHSPLQRMGLRLVSKPFLREDETQQLFADFTRHMLKSIPQTWNIMPTNPGVLLATTTLQKVASGNAMGEILFRMLTPAKEKLLEQKCGENVQVAATRLALAVRCYHLEKGEPPEKLEALVPNYISEIPQDDFDGQPMKYSREKKVVYSVGRNLVDDGGTTNQVKGVRLDQSYELKFLP